MKKNETPFFQPSEAHTRVFQADEEQIIIPSAKGDGAEFLGSKRKPDVILPVSLTKRKVARSKN